MAHYGNNALNVMRNQAEYCGELVEDLDANQAPRSYASCA